MFMCVYICMSMYLYLHVYVCAHTGMCVYMYMCGMHCIICVMFVYSYVCMCNKAQIFLSLSGFYPTAIIRNSPSQYFLLVPSHFPSFILRL